MVDRWLKAIKDKNFIEFRNREALKNDPIYDYLYLQKILSIYCDLKKTQLYKYTLRPSNCDFV